VKVVATRCHISKVKCTEFGFNWGSTPDPTSWFLRGGGQGEGKERPKTRGRIGVNEMEVDGDRVNIALPDR